MAKGIQVVVGELQLLEGNELAAPVRTGSGGIWVHVEPSGHCGFCLPRHRPAEETRGHQGPACHGSAADDSALIQTSVFIQSSQRDLETLKQPPTHRNVRASPALHARQQ